MVLDCPTVVQPSGEPSSSRRRARPPADAGDGEIERTTGLLRKSGFFVRRGVAPAYPRAALNQPVRSRGNGRPRPTKAAAHSPRAATAKETSKPKNCASQPAPVAPIAMLIENVIR